MHNSIEAQHRETNSDKKTEDPDKRMAQLFNILATKYPEHRTKTMQ